MQLPRPVLNLSGALCFIAVATAEQLVSSRAYWRRHRALAAVGQ